MEKKVFRIVNALICVLCLIFISGCNKRNSASEEADKTTRLRWMMLGPGKQYDSERVWDAFNKKLQEKLPNITLNVDCLTRNEYYEKWRLTVASREEVDLAWTGWLLPYTSEVRKGAYLPLDDLISNYAPELFAELPEVFFKQARVDGEIYSVPNYQMIANTRLGIYVPTEISDKYWNTEKAEEIFLENDTMTKDCYNIVEEYLEALMRNNKLNLGLSTSTFYWFAYKGFDEIVDPFVVRIGDSRFEVMNKFETEEAKLMFDKMADWFKKGYIRKDILSVKNPRSSEGQRDKYALWVHGNFRRAEENNIVVSDFPITVVPAEDKYYIKNGGPSTATAIASASKYPEQAMRLLGLLQSDEGTELFNMLVYGIEGEHYIKQSEKSIEPVSYVGQAGSLAKYGLWKWAVGNTFLGYNTNDIPDYWEEYIKEEVNANAIPSPLISFKADTEPIKAELAQIYAVVKEYENSLMHGALANHKDIYNEFIRKMNVMNLAKVKDIIQKQVDEYVRDNHLR